MLGKHLPLLQADSSLQMKPHPEEVDDVKWVTLEEMDEMMADEGEFYITGTK